jgi:hypothetical protein
MLLVFAEPAGFWKPPPNFGKLVSKPDIEFCSYTRHLPEPWITSIAACTDVIVRVLETKFKRTYLFRLCLSWIAFERDDNRSFEGCKELAFTNSLDIRKP